MNSSNIACPILEKGDIIIDGGNSLLHRYQSAYQGLKEKGHPIFIGTGISGGEEGARHGPSIMPGGNPEAWPHVKRYFQAIAAKADTGEPCCDWVGDEGAGHYVKMVHNGIEYGDMQLIGEAYHLVEECSWASSCPDCSRSLRNGIKRELDSYLIEITSQIFAYQGYDGNPLVDKILDVAGQKGTGKWTVINALDMGMPLTLNWRGCFCPMPLCSQRGKSAKPARSCKGPKTTF